MLKTTGIRAIGHTVLRHLQKFISNSWNHCLLVTSYTNLSERYYQRKWLLFADLVAFWDDHQFDASVRPVDRNDTQDWRCCCGGNVILYSMFCGSLMNYYYGWLAQLVTLFNHGNVLARNLFRPALLRTVWFTCDWTGWRRTPESQSPKQAEEHIFQLSDESIMRYYGWASHRRVSLINKLMILLSNDFSCEAGSWCAALINQ